MNFCTPEYFRVMQMRLLRGRLLEERDGPAAPEVIVINDTLARRYFPNEDPVGRRLKLTPHWQTIVGVIADWRSRPCWRDRPKKTCAVRTTCS